MKGVKQVIDRVGNNPAYITGNNQQYFAPFALFDAGRVPSHDPLLIDWHPHSGVATITFPYDATLHHADSAGNGGIIADHGLQWMASGKGIWHKESYQATSPDNKIGIMQLWLMLDPQQETQPASYFNLQPEEIPQVQDDNGNLTRVLLGEYQGLKAARAIKHNVTYLDVHLTTGESWEFSVPAKQVRGFVYPRVGQIKIAGTQVASQQLALLNEDEETLCITALQDSQFVVALTELWPHPVVAHYGQIHTSKQALKIGSEHIQHLKLELIEKLNNGVTV